MNMKSPHQSERSIASGSSASNVKNNGSPPRYDKSKLSLLKSPKISTANASQYDKN